MALLTAQAGPLPVSPPGALSAPFWEGAAAGELRYLRCASCGQADFPPAPHCRNCLQEAQRWEVSAGAGTVYSYTVVWRPVTPDFSTPYAPAIVTLDEGYSLLTNLIDLDSDDVRVGMRVRVQFAAVPPGGGGLTLPYFRPDPAAAIPEEGAS